MQTQIKWKILKYRSTIQILQSRHFLDMVWNNYISHCNNFKKMEILPGFEHHQRESDGYLGLDNLPVVSDDKTQGLLFDWIFLLLGIREASPFELNSKLHHILNVLKSLDGE